LSLWVPPKVARELREETLEYNVSTLDMFDLFGPFYDKWNRELKKLDPMLRLGKAKEKAFAVGVIPGYYHLIRINPGAPLWTMPLHDSQGRFVEPTSRMLDQLRERDMQNMRVVRDRQKQIAVKEKADEKAKQDRREYLEEKAEEHYAARFKTRVSFNPNMKWSQNVAGRRGVLAK
jgi:hypothetical protein